MIVYLLYLLMQENMMFREEPLTGSQIMRGAYINSGEGSSWIEQQFQA